MALWQWRTLTSAATPDGSSQPAASEDQSREAQTTQESKDYGQQRQASLAADRQSKDPVFKESYPRLKTAAMPMAVPTIRKIYMDPQCPGIDNDDVTVYGMLAKDLSS